tara:strand:+ start:1205 stop:1840 length:636 start_codon:yes stop_codon:yes gene_type:complete
MPPLPLCGVLHIALKKECDWFKNGTNRMSDTSPKPVRFDKLPQGQDFTFTITPDADTRQDIAARLDLLSLRKVRFEGKIAPLGKTDWQLTAIIGATVVQPSVVSLEPVSTRIDDPVTRIYRKDVAVIQDEEAEMPEDDTVEAIPVELNLMEVLEEALALSLPLYPRAADEQEFEATYTPPGVEPIKEADIKPFAGLADLKKRLEGDDGTGK